MPPIQEESCLARAMLLDYARKPDRSEKDWEPILAAYQASDNGFIWEDAFSVDRPLLQAIWKEKSKKQAREALVPFEDTKDSSETIILRKITATLCLSEVGANEEALRSGGQISREVFDRIQVWKAVFSGQDWFSGVLEKEMEKMRHRHAQIHQSLNVETRAHSTGQLRLFSLPSKCQERPVGETPWSACQHPPANILDPLNEFAAEYLGGMQFSLSDDGASWLVRDIQNATVADHRANVRRLLGGPYGQAAMEIKVLSGACEVRIGWDACGLKVKRSSPSRRQGPR